MLVMDKTAEDVSHSVVRVKATGILNYGTTRDYDHIPGIKLTNCDVYVCIEQNMPG